METLKKIGLWVLAVLGGLVAIFSLQGKKTDKVLKDNEKAVGHVEELGESIKEKLDEIKVEKKKEANLEKQKKEIEDEKDIDSNTDYFDNF